MAYPTEILNLGRQCVGEKKQMIAFDFKETSPGIWEGDTESYYHMIIDARNMEKPTFTAIRKHDSEISMFRELKDPRAKKKTNKKKRIKKYG